MSFCAHSHSVSAVHRLMKNEMKEEAGNSLKHETPVERDEKRIQIMKNGISREKYERQNLYSRLQTATAVKE